MAKGPAESSDVRVVREGGMLLDAAVKGLFELSWGKARACVTTGKIKVDGEVVTSGTKRVKVGARLELTMHAPRPRPAGELRKDAFVHIDAHVVVVKKPAGISTIPYDEKETGTLDERVRDFLSRSAKGVAALGIVHRLDKETSGLIVFTRTWLAKKSLTDQFRVHTVHRRYLAICHGDVIARTFRSHLVPNRGDGLRGSLEAMRGRKGPISAGQLAVTHVEPLEKLRGATLVSCKLETGRTHQIRVHLSEAGHPIVGERVYIRGFPGPELAAPRMMLHAAELGFVHPATNEEVRWAEDPPPDFAETLARLR